MSRPGVNKHSKKVGNMPLSTLGFVDHLSGTNTWLCVTSGRSSYAYVSRMDMAASILNFRNRWETGFGRWAIDPSSRLSLQIRVLFHFQCYSFTGFSASKLFNHWKYKDFILYLGSLGYKKFECFVLSEFLLLATS